MKNGYNGTARDVLWPVIANDLAYVAQYWNSTGFDLWEEVRGSSFFTTASQHRGACVEYKCGFYLVRVRTSVACGDPANLVHAALREGAVFSAAIGEICEYCDPVAQQVLCFMRKYWSEKNSHIISNSESIFFYHLPKPSSTKMHPPSQHGRATVWPRRQFHSCLHPQF